MLVQELLITHKEYKPDCLQKHQDFYDGGESFEANKKHYLNTRMYEKMGGAGAENLRESRLASAAYTPHVAGLINFMVSATMQSKPGILVDTSAEEKDEKAPKVPEDKIDYYHGLNTNADGKGQDFEALIRSRLVQCMIHRRSYFAVRFPKPSADVELTDLAQQREEGVLNAQIFGKDAKDVDDWEYKDGVLQWVRTHCVEFTRSTRFGPIDTEKHTWAFITDRDIQEYTASRSLEDAKKYGPNKWEDGVVATPLPPEPHSLGVVPVIPIDLEPGLHLMNALFPMAKSLFNREASEDFALDTSAFAIPILTTDAPIDSVIASEIAVMKLPTGSKFEWGTPPTGHFEALAKNAEQKRENLFLAVQAMSIQAATKDSSGRASGVAKSHDLSMIATLLSAFASAVRDAMEKTLSIIKKARNEENIKLTLTGLDEFDVAALESLLKQVQEFCKLPASSTAKRHALEKVALGMCHDAPAPIRRQIREESKKLDVEMEERVAESGNQESASEIRQKNTNEVEGFGTQTL